MTKHLRSTAFFIGSFLFLSLTSVHQLKACTGHDVIINKLTFTSITSTEYAYTYEIKNIGTAAIALNQIVLQNYISTDEIYGQNDAAGGGTFIAPSNASSIPAGGTYTGTYAIYPGTGKPISSYPYFITEVYLNSETECDLTNNEYSGAIEVVTTGTKSAQVASATVNWDAYTKSFSVKDWSGSTAFALQYKVVAVSGIVVFSGNTTEGQSTPLNALQTGMYILYLTDGEKVFSTKIRY